MTLLSARGLSVVPPGAREPVVRDFVLEVEPGDWIVLTGPNGGGKSSLLLGLSALWPAAGSLTLRGLPFVPAGDPATRRGVSVLLQDPSSQLLLDRVDQELSFAARNAGAGAREVDREVARVSDALGLAPDLPRRPESLSAGRQQLVLLGAALVSGPEILFADEITAHLDAAARAAVLQEIERRVARGMAAVWVTQEATELRRATRVLEVPGGPAAGRQEGPLARRTRGAGPGAVPSGTAVLSIAIAPASCGTGPRVEIAEPMEIPVAGTGVTALAGPNGSGKSVVLAAAAGFGSLPQVGIRWRAQPSPPPSVALQYPELQVFQERVGDELVFAAVSRGVDPGEAEAGARRLLDRLALPAGLWIGRRTWDLPGGVKRLVEVAAALLAPASLYVLDEPTAGLDPERRERLGELVAEVASRRPVLLASQDHEWVASLGARRFDLRPGPQDVSKT